MAAQDFVYFRNIPLQANATNGATSTVGEPSLLNNGNSLFYTGNWYASRSTDNGANWTFVDPSTTLPSAAGGFCCDQLAIYEPSRNLSIWLLQYIKDGAGENVFRIAINDNDQMNSWYWWDFSPTSVDSSFGGTWFDYPDMAVSDNYLWITFNMFNASDRWQRAVVFKMPLDAIAERTSLGYQHWATTSNGSLRLTQGAGDIMYWGSHGGGSSIRLSQWPENSNSISSWTIGVSSWSGGNYSALGPDGNDWLGRLDPRITGAWTTCDDIGFMWSANRTASRPFPHVRVVKINKQSKTLSGEPDIWSNNAAFAYPAVCPNTRGHLGISAFYGGGTRNPSHVTGISDDYNNLGWSFWFSSIGTDGPTAGTWGDYLNVRPHYPDGNSWIASGFTLQGGSSRNNIVPRYLHFGRARDTRGARRY